MFIVVVIIDHAGMNAVVKSWEILFRRLRFRHQPGGGEIRRRTGGKKGIKEREKTENGKT